MSTPTVPTEAPSPTPAALAEALFLLLHPIFRDCVEPDSIRYFLAVPWIDRG